MADRSRYRSRPAVACAACKNRLAWFALVLVAMLWCGHVQAGEDWLPNELTVRPLKQRISDEVIEQDRQVFRLLRTRVDQAGREASAERACVLAKAEAWLNVAEEEYEENEDGAVVDLTLQEAQRLIRPFDGGGVATALRDLQIPDSRQSRPDLWKLWKELEEREPVCACSARARLEVQLVWADHESLEGASHARPYFETAERLAAVAQQAADAVCPVNASVATLPVKVPTVQVPTPLVEPPNPGPPVVQDTLGPTHEEGTPAVSTPETTQASLAEEPSLPSEPSLPIAGSTQDPEPEIVREAPSDVISLATLPWSVHFSTNRASISPATGRVLDQMADVLKKYPVAQIRLEGHADQRGDVSYNRILSDRRTKAVKAYLVEAGIAADHISMRALGKTQPLTQSRKNREMARNRRVVIVVTNIEKVRSEVQDADLQPDQRRALRRTGRPAEQKQVSGKPSRSGRAELKRGGGR